MPSMTLRLEASRALLGLAAAARGQEHRDEAERMKEAAQKILRRHQAHASSQSSQELAAAAPR